MGDSKIAVYYRAPDGAIRAREIDVVNIDPLIREIFELGFPVWHDDIEKYTVKIPPSSIVELRYYILSREERLWLQWQADFDGFLSESKLPPRSARLIRGLSYIERLIYDREYRVSYSCKPEFKNQSLFMRSGQLMACPDWLNEVRLGHIKLKGYPGIGEKKAQMILDDLKEPTV